MKLRSDSGHWKGPPDGEYVLKRDWRFMIGGALVAVLGSILLVHIFAEALHEERVVVAARLIPYDKVIEPADLKIVTIRGAAEFDLILEEQLGSLIGQTALFGIPEGALLVEGMIGKDPVPEGFSVVGLFLTEGRLPTVDMPEGREQAIQNIRPQRRTG